MLQLKDISYQFSGIPLFDKINWTINPKKRVALIGPNGAGKTTLIRLISQNIPLQEGIIQKPKSYQIGYLPQEEISFGRGSVLEEVLLADQEFGKLEAEIADIHEQLDDGNLAVNEQINLTNRLGLLETRFALSGGYEREAQAKKILTGLGFKPGEFSDPISTKSGGWRMRVYLARLLLQNPDLLLMDEPTNHLDIVSLEWLENFLIGYPGSIIIVSHDRFFIDRLANEIAELEHGRLTHYAGNYAYYEKEKEIRYAQLTQKAEALNAERERLTQFINRFRYKATKAVQVQDRIKRLEKLETIHLPKATPRINFKINSPIKSYKDVCMLKGVSFRYALPWVFQDVDLSLYRGEKVALVGANGEGKTTLTRLIFGQIQPQIGTVSVGERVKMGYYAQHQIDDLNTENNVYAEVESVVAEELRTQIRDILGVFRFSGADTEKRVGVLSGGEKARVSLAKILLSPVNFLIMDEPTNHLDLYSKEALETALKNYDGTLLLISHDRYFLDKLVKVVFELKDGRLLRFEGNYSDYLKKKLAEETKLQVTDQTSESKKISHRDKEQKRAEAEARQLISKERKTLAQKIESVEKAIHSDENEKERIEKLMADPEFYKQSDKVAEFGKKYQEILDRLPGLYESWEILHQKMDSLLASIKKSG